MRLWLIKPSLLCRKHLIAEHYECHTFVGAIIYGRSIKGYIDNGLVEPSKISSRHDELVTEMGRRGINHSSLLPNFELGNLAGLGKVNVKGNEEILFQKCEECRKLMEEEEK